MLSESSAILFVPLPGVDRLNFLIKNVAAKKYAAAAPAPITHSHAGFAIAASIPVLFAWIISIDLGIDSR